MDSKERNEDLNPHGDDIEERVRQMLDPSIPDSSATEPEAPTPVIKKKTQKPITVQHVDSAEPASDMSAAAPSAPELPVNETEAKLVPGKKPKKIIPVSHDESLPELNAKVDSTGPSQPEVAPKVKKITIDDSKSTADLAAALDASIAELEPTESDAAPDSQTESVAEEAEGLPEELPATGELPEEPVSDPDVIADPATDKAIDDIVVAESDELLQVEDAIRDTDEPIEASKKSKKERHSFGQTLKTLWARKSLRWGVLLIVIAALAGLGTVPVTRYKALNLAGVRAASSLTVFDESTQQPLKNVQVKIGDISETTDVNGKVRLSKVPLGSSLLTVEKRAFAPVTKTIVVGWGSNPLGDFKLTPTGSQYSFTVTDFLSGKPISKVEASSGEASALSDDKGLIKLTLDKLDDHVFTVLFKGDDYRTEKLDVDPNTKTVLPQKLVPARKQVFVSKRSGKFDIYSVYVDGKDEKLVLPGSGAERDDMVLVSHPTANLTAYVSTRGNQHNSDGFLLSNLMLVNLDDNSTVNIGAAERVQIVDWSGDNLIYVQIAAGTSANSPKRYRLMSYNYKDQSNKELAASNFFNDVVFAGGEIYYAPSSANQPPGTANLYRVNADGSGSQTVFNKEVWNIFRTAYDHFTLSVQQEWYDYHLGVGQPVKLNSAPAEQITRVYIDSPDGKHSVWVDNRDGKGVLLSYDTSSKTDTTLRSQAGITYPARWLNNKVLVYRVKSPQETADYAISIDGGEPVKIRDVTNSGGIDRWYYY